MLREVTMHMAVGFANDSFHVVMSFISLQT